MAGWRPSVPITSGSREATEFRPAGVTTWMLPVEASPTVAANCPTTSRKAVSSTGLARSGSTTAVPERSAMRVKESRGGEAEVGMRAWR